MDGALDLAAVGSVAALGGRVVGAAQFDDSTRGRILDRLLTGDEVGPAQAHLAAGGQAVVLARRVFHEVVALDVELAAEGHGPRAHLGRIVGEIGRGKLVDLVVGVVGDDHLQRVQHGHDPGGLGVEVVSNGVFQLVQADPGLALAHADDLAEIADGLGRDAPAAQAGDGGHARVVPAADVAALDQGQELAFAHDGVVEVEPGEFDLLGVIDAQLIEHPVVEHAVVLELQGADGVGDALDGVGEAVGEVVHGVDQPLVAGAMMADAADAIERGVAQDDVGRGHVDLGPQDPGPVGKLAVAHAPEEVEVLLDRTIAPGAVDARRGEGAPRGADLLGALVVDVGLAGLDQLFGEIVELVKVIGGVEAILAPVEAQPAHVFLDGVDVFDIFLGGVGVVEAQVALALIIAGQAEIQADALGVADVQIAVGLGGKTGDHPPAPFARGHVFVDDVADKVARRRVFGRAHNGRSVG